MPINISLTKACHTAKSRTKAREAWPVLVKGDAKLSDDMDEPGGHYAKFKSQTQKDKYCMITLGCGVQFIEPKTRTVVTRG